MFTECTKTLLCILMRNDSKQLSLFSSSCSELSNIMLLSMVLSTTSLNSFPLTCCRKADKTASLTSRFISTALSSTTLQSGDDSIVFHLTHCRTAGSLPAAGSGEVAGYNMKIPTAFPVPFQHTFPKHFWIPGWTCNVFFAAPKSAASAIHLSVPPAHHLGHCH